MKRHLVNIHIPKTAGSALRKNLEDIFYIAPPHPSFLIGPRFGKFEDISEEFTGLLPALFERKERMISGHYRYRDIADRIAHVRKEVSLITFLREPVRRTISDYFYSISDVNTDPAGFKAKFPTFEHYMQDTEQHINKTFNYLRPNNSASSLETLQNTIEKFDFVGITENFKADLDHILTGLEQQTTVVQRVNENQNQEAANEAYEKYATQLHDILTDDCLIYNGILEHRNLALTA